jgi:hypothetical protein
MHHLFSLPGWFIVCSSYGYIVMLLAWRETSFNQSINQSMKYTVLLHNRWFHGKIRESRSLTTHNKLFQNEAIRKAGVAPHILNCYKMKPSGKPEFHHT